VQLPDKLLMYEDDCGRLVNAIKLSLGVQTFRFGSIRGLSFFEKKTQTSN
jgi:hypothetical protein